MFTKSAAFYDAIYSFKDYAEESRLAEEFIRKYKISPGNSLLDVACGTGQHAQYLRENYQVAGLDLDAGLLEVARQRLPDLGGAVRGGPQRDEVLSPVDDRRGLHPDPLRP